MKNGKDEEEGEFSLLLVFFLCFFFLNQQSNMKNSCFSLVLVLNNILQKPCVTDKRWISFSQIHFCILTIKDELSVVTMQRNILHPLKKRRHLTVTQEITGNTGFHLNCSEFSVLWQWCQTFLQRTHGFCKVCEALWPVWLSLLLLLLHFYY